MASDESTGAKRATEPAELNTSEPASVPNRDPENVKAQAADSTLTEDVALSLLKRSDLPGEVLEQLAKNGSLSKLRKVKLALVEHPKTPRHVSVPLVRELYTFDLMRVALTPVVPADIKQAADEPLCNRMETISVGEKLTLAHRASRRVAGGTARRWRCKSRPCRPRKPEAYRTDHRARIDAHDAPTVMVEAVCRHPQWSVRCEIRVALLRTEKTPLARAVEFARGFPAAQVREILRNSRLPGNIKAALLKDIETRVSGANSRS